MSPTVIINIAYYIHCIYCNVIKSIIITMSICRSTNKQIKSQLKRFWTFTLPTHTFLFTEFHGLSHICDVGLFPSGEMQIEVMQICFCCFPFTRPCYFTSHGVLEDLCLAWKWGYLSHIHGTYLFNGFIS